MFHVTHRVTSKQKIVVDTKKIKIRESKYTTVGNHQFMKENSKRWRNNEITKQPEKN